MVPYYFDIPELELPFDVDDKPYVQHPADYMSPSGLGLGGNSFQYRVVPENWYADVKQYLEDRGIEYENNIIDDYDERTDFYKEISIN